MLLVWSGRGTHSSSVQPMHALQKGTSSTETRKITEENGLKQNNNNKRSKASKNMAHHDGIDSQKELAH